MLHRDDGCLHRMLAWERLRWLSARSPGRVLPVHPLHPMRTRRVETGRVPWLGAFHISRWPWLPLSPRPTARGVRGGCGGSEISPVARTWSSRKRWSSQDRAGPPGGTARPRLRPFPLPGAVLAHHTPAPTSRAPSPGFCRHFRFLSSIHPSPSLRPTSSGPRAAGSSTGGGMPSSLCFSHPPGGPPAEVTISSFRKIQ